MKQVLIVEDQRMPRKYMESMISDSKYYALAASISGADVALAYCKRQMIDLILMDVCTSGNKDGIEASAEIKAAFPDIKIIIVTSMVEAGFLERAKAAKVDSFWYKDLSPEDLLDVIDRTMAGEQIFPRETPPVKLGLVSSTDLTAKEIQVLRLLSITERTVKYHVSNILQKTGYANKTRLAIAVTGKKFIIPSLPEDLDPDITG